MTIFHSSYNHCTVQESNPPGQLLCSVTTVDPDLHQNQYLTYSLIEKEIANASMSLVFHIHPGSASSFDYEIKEEFLFHIESRDSGICPHSTTVPVDIINLEQNNNTPVSFSTWPRSQRKKPEVICQGQTGRHRLIT